MVSAHLTFAKPFLVDCVKKKVITAHLFRLAFLFFFLGGGGYVSFILMPSKRAWGTLDCGIEVHSTQMGISWTLGLQSIAQTSTNKQEHRITQADHFFNKPFLNLSIIVHMAHEIVKHQCNVQHGPSTSSQGWFVKLSINSAHGTSNA